LFACCCGFFCLVTVRSQAGTLSGGIVDPAVYPLHAKLYLAYSNDPRLPVMGFLGSSNLTFAGLVKQGELNIDVVEQDAAMKLAAWFDERWNRRLDKIKTHYII